MNTITIDCGASFIKGALFSDGVIQKKMQRSAPKVHSDADIFSAVQIGELLPIVREMVLELGRGGSVLMRFKRNAWILACL